MNPQSFIFIGRAGAGKGTQAKILENRLRDLDSRSVLHVETGEEFRKFLKGDNYTVKLAKEIIYKGGLMPEFMPIYMWAEFLTKNYTGNEHLIFDGTPRKLLEAKILASAITFYGIVKPYVIYLDIEHSHTSERVSLRAKNSGRNDDRPEVLESRKIAFERDVKPTIDWYRQNPDVVFLDIDGKTSIEEVSNTIWQKLGFS